MNYLIAALPDRIQAEAAYTALEQAGLPQTQLDILGNGYKSADEFGLIDPAVPAKQGTRRLLNWLLPFGFLAGFLFNALTQIQILPIAPIGNHILGGLLGAIAGGMGAYTVGRTVSASVGSGDALPYRNRLDAGQYLVAVKGSDAQIEQATRILRQFNPETLQGYADREPERALNR